MKNIVPKKVEWAKPHCNFYLSNKTFIAVCPSVFNKIPYNHYISIWMKMKIKLSLERD